MAQLPLHYDSCLVPAQSFTATSEEARSALYWLERWTKERAYDRWYRQPCRNREKFWVADHMTIRTRRIELVLHVQPDGRRIRRWYVDGHSWRDSEVRQLVG
jgi:hypothetical protein